MPYIPDQADRSVLIRGIPRRIVSLVPSQTELLFDLGLEAEVVGITKFCVHPEQWFRTKTRVGGTKNVNIEAVRALQPDLIIANKEENVQEQVEALEQIAPVWVSNVNTLADAIEMIHSIGRITGKEDEAIAISNKITTGLRELRQGINTAVAPPLTCYLIWKDPWMTIGGDTFISEMLMRGGFHNAFAWAKRYPTITIEQIRERKCELLLLSSEPYPFKEKHIQELQQQLPETTILLVDGEMFSWYGSRLLYAFDYIRKLRLSCSHLIKN